MTEIEDAKLTFDNALSEHKRLIDTVRAYRNINMVPRDFLTMKSFILQLSEYIDHLRKELTIYENTKYPLEEFIDSIADDTNELKAILYELKLYQI